MVAATGLFASRQIERCGTVRAGFQTAEAGQDPPRRAKDCSDAEPGPGMVLDDQEGSARGFQRHVARGSRCGFVPVSLVGFLRRGPLRVVLSAPVLGCLVGIAARPVPREPVRGALVVLAGGQRGLPLFSGGPWLHEPGPAEHANDNASKKA